MNYTTCNVPHVRFQRNLPLQHIAMVFLDQSDTFFSKVVDFLISLYFLMGRTMDIPFWLLNLPGATAEISPYLLQIVGWGWPIWSQKPLRVYQLY